MDKLKIGMVGMGFIAEWHYKGFAPHNNKAEIVGMCQDFHGSPEKIAEKKIQLTESYRQLCDF